MEISLIIYFFNFWPPYHLKVILHRISVYIWPGGTLELSFHDEKGLELKKNLLQSCFSIRLPELKYAELTYVILMI
jgi:hypothetical protein